ncbi:DUF896 domain-containing protein [Moraxella catarrhalis]|uniref:DUF896 domain-containing protein n=2 Tax=Moraxella TaxID=475 RepID=A0A7Z0V0L3_MORCA|nr:DUF896 domain-containing protein [Moraxella catarrhalis]OAV02232.1 unknown conserved protein in Bsubtilis [Moraxella catarrhalis]STY81505.1 Uncharacterized protein conserved in bacteria [Moraxella catarrhalis]
MRIVELDRINELAHITKTAGLTQDELTERDELRQRYLAQIRGQVLNSLGTVTLLDEADNDVTPTKLRDAQKHSALVN